MGWIEVGFYLGIVAIPTGMIFWVVWRTRGED